MRPQTPLKNCWTKLLLKLKLLPLRLQRLLKLLLTRLLQLLKQLSTLLKKLLLTKLKLSYRERGRKAPFAFPPWPFRSGARHLQFHACAAVGGVFAQEDAVVAIITPHIAGDAGLDAYGDEFA